MVVTVVVLEVLTHLVLEWNQNTPGAGILVGMLSGMAVLYVMAFSAALLRKSHGRTAWAGATLVSVGIACSIPPPAGAGVALASMGLAFLSTFALLLPSLGLVLKESLLTGRRREVGNELSEGKKLDIFAVAAVSSLGQLLGYVIHGTCVGKQLWTLSAWSVSSGTLVKYVAASAVIRLAIVLTIGRTSALAVQLANAVAIPLGAVISLAPCVSTRLLLGLTSALVGLGACIAAWRAPAVVEKSEKRRSSRREADEEAELVRESMRMAETAAWAAEEMAAREAARQAAEAALKAEREAEAEMEKVRQEEAELLRQATTAKRLKFARDAGRVAAGAFVAITLTVFAGTMVAAELAIAAGAVVTAGALLATDVAAARSPDRQAYYQYDAHNSSGRSKEELDGAAVPRGRRHSPGGPPGL